jgi:hypothetical protein
VKLQEDMLLPNHVHCFRHFRPSISPTTSPGAGAPGEVVFMVNISGSQDGTGL